MGLGIALFVFGLALTTVHGCDSHLPEDAITGNFDGTCYALIFSAESYKLAADDCKKYGGMLALAKTEGVNNFLADILKNNSVNVAWFGLSDRDDADSYKWADGTPLHVNSDFDNFADHEGPYNDPLHGRWEDSFGIDQNGYWHDYRSAVRVGFITVTFNKLPFLCQF